MNQLMRHKQTTPYIGIIFAMLLAAASAAGPFTPGTTLIVTDQPVSPRTHSAPGFNILTAESTTSKSKLR
jgi:hypothetical protein